MTNWLDKYEPGGTVAKTDATRVAAPTVKLTKKQLEQNKAINKQVMANTKKAEAKKVQDRRDRIAVADAVKPYQFQSLKNFAVANSAIGDELRVSENPNFFDDYLNFPSFIGHLASGLGQAPLNIQQGNYGQAAMNIAAPVVAGAAETILSPMIGKATVAGKKAIKKGIDQAFTETGRALAKIEREGIKKGLSQHEINMQQMDQVGITSRQREGYIPGVSELAYKYVTPYGYDNLGNSKLRDIISNIKQGGVFYDAVKPSRNDSWRLYLGMPQKYGTFEIAQTAPINHVAYTPKQLKGLEILSMKKDPDIRFPTVNPIESPSGNSPRPFRYDRWYEGQDYLDNDAVVEFGHDIMGGFNQRLTKAGLEYNDVWDLNPPITPYNYLPKKLQSVFDESPLFFENVRGVSRPKNFKIPVDKFVGKPFMVHGVNPNLTSTHLVDKMKNAAIREITVGAPEAYQKRLNLLGDEESGFTNRELAREFKAAVKKYNEQLRHAKQRLEDLKDYPKFKEGGWLDKYDDGGDMNANHYTVSAPEGYLGDGTFNQGRNYSPAWGGQFENGGPVKRFMQPTETFKNIGYNPLENGLSTEYSTSIGAPGEIYLVPGYRQGRVLNDPEGVFNTYGEHLGGPFKTVQSAEDFAKLRHKYVEQNKNIPAPFKTRDYAMGGSLPGAVGHMYAREGAPRNFGGKMTVPSAEDGIELNETEPVKQPSTKPEDRTKQEENYMNRAPLDIIEEGRSKFRFNMLKDAVRHQMADEYLIPLDKVNDKELTDRAKKLLLARENKLANPTVEFVKGKGATNVDGVLGYYDPSNKGALISLSDNLNDYDIDEFGRTVRHEFRHAYDDAGTLLTHYENELIKNKTAPEEADKIKTIGQGEYNYLSRPTEVTARLQEIRGSLKDNPLMLGYLKKEKDSPISLYDKVDKEGYYLDDFTGKRVPIQRTYDPKKDKATIEHLKSLKNHSGYEELLKVMKPEDIVELLNTIAANNPQQGLPMAQNGMQFYQNGLDFKPKSISKNGSVIEDDRGQWAHPGKVTKIGSNKITMKGVPYPVLGISDTGDMQMMYPNQEYQYIGDSVTEYPMMKQGGQLTKLDQLTNFTNYNTKQPGGWLDKYQD